jgi:hypothetical protein
MAGIKKISVQELNNLKFHVVENFGMLSKGRFFITDTIPPIQYGADCKDYTWYEVQCNTTKDYSELATFIKNIFGIVIDVSSKKIARKAVDALMNQFKGEIHEVDWGACHVCYIPIAKQFRI